jgi:hypothetical protein
LALPPLPDGFTLEPPRKGRRLPLDDYTPAGDIVDRGKADTNLPPLPEGFTLETTGDVVDGDTIRLADKRNGRVLGFDAFEANQPGIAPDGSRVPLGQLATNALDGYVTPQTNVRGIGAKTYNRPVVTLDNGGDDPIVPMLQAGHGYAAPEYMQGDPQRSALYMEAERLARLNLQGGHGTQHLIPEMQRKTQRWGLKLRPDEEMVWTSELPELRPEFQRLDTAEEQDYYAFIASKSGDQTFGQADIDAYWKSKGKEAMAADPEFLASIRRGEKFGNIDYSAWDAATLRNFHTLNAFAGMRPEVQEAYGAMLAAPDSTPETLKQFANVNGMTFAADDVEAFFAAKAEGKDAPIPLPLINPGDGALGAGKRGAGDGAYIGLYDEGGALIDVITPQWMRRGRVYEHRENMWNSDRSFGDIYENNLRQNRAILGYDAEHHPYARFGGQLIGGAVIPFGAGARGAAGFAKVGGAYGGVYGFNSADGSLMDRVANVPLSAALGAGGGAVLGKTIEAGAPLVQRGWAKLTGRDGAPMPDAAPDAAPDPAPADAPALPAPPPPAPRAAEVADMASEPLPSITGPRERDVIDVNATRTRPLMEPPSDSLIRAATSRVEPGDVLPRPSNVPTEADAAALGRGGVDPVKAPRERDYLETSQFPSRANPENTITRKGPSDLVTFMRSLNGIRDDGGELTAAGISNAARKGEDFAGGENRLGKLVNPEGIGLEEAAERAWREGYFPELDAPPTNAKFVAALDDTYRGVGRRFLPEDEAQIQAYEGARDQRLAVERAQQEGAPLHTDTSAPASLDDIMANTPPATAYDDWNNAVVSKVGNIRVDKLDSAQDIGQALKIAENVAGGFDAARRGVITQAETKALARDLGMTADDLLARRRGQAMNAEEMYAARAILGKANDELVKLAQRIQRTENPGDELLADFHKAMVRSVAIQEQVSGATAEAGRLLQQFRMAASSKDAPGRILAGLANAGGGAKRLREAAEAIITLQRDPGSLNKFIEAANRPTLSDKLQEVWYNFLLSGPQTHVVNMLSNTLTSLAQIPEHALAAGIGGARRAFNKNAQERLAFTEVGARATGLLQGAREGVREIASRFAAKEGDPTGAWNTAKRWGNAIAEAEPADLATKVEAHAQRAISGWKGKAIRVPTSALTIEDEFFKAIARRSEMAGQAVRIARSEGLRGEAGKRRAAELLANPTDEMWEKSLDYARYATFQRPLGEAASKVSAFTQAMPIAKAVLPFVRTPTNLFKFAVERSPFAPLLREWRKDFAAGGAQRDLAVARATIGAGIGALVAEAAEMGLITGSVPPDKNKRRLQNADGWEPYSVKIGDKYYSYRRLDPFAITIGSAADMATLGDGMTDGQKDKGAALVVASIMNNLTNKTWMSGLSDMLAGLRDPERYGGRFVDRFAGSALVPTGVAQVARTVDPVARETDGTLEYIQSRIPGLSDNLLPKRDVWGREMVSEGGIGPDIMSPIWVSTEKGDPATHEAIRVGAVISPPSESVGGKKLDARTYNRLQMVTGQTAHKWVSELIKQPDYRALDTEGQAKAIKFVMDKAREAGRANVIGGVPTPTMRPEKGQRLPGARARELPPLPAGFEIE